MFRYLVLGLLRRGEAQHGYAMMKAYRDRAGIQVSTGNFYRELSRLVSEGLVRTVSNPPGNDPRRAPYEITEDGSAAFDAWLAEPLGTAMWSHEDVLSARALFLAEAGGSVAGTALDQWQEELWQRGKMLERAREAAMRTAPGGRGGPFEPLALLLARRLKHIAADLEFLEEFRSAYQEWAAEPQRSSLSSGRARIVRRQPVSRIPGPR